jgi:nickel-type superoxide dismutase maturation protease
LRACASLNAAGLTAVILAVAAARRFTRYEVAGPSMLPALRAGDWLLADRRAYARSRLRAGHVVVARDPRDPSRTIIKRVTRVCDDGQVCLAGDNAAESTDSRTFGPVSAEEIIGRVRLRYWPSPRRF